MTQPFLPNKADAFNVKDFGAVGDGTTDDTAAVQAAIDAAEVNGGLVDFPPNSFLINCTIDSGNVMLFGTMI